VDVPAAAGVACPSGQQTPSTITQNITGVDNGNNASLTQLTDLQDFYNQCLSGGHPTVIAIQEACVSQANFFEAFLVNKGVGWRGDFVPTDGDLGPDANCSEAGLAIYTRTGGLVETIDNPYAVQNEERVAQTGETRKYICHRVNQGSSPKYYACDTHLEFLDPNGNVRPAQDAELAGEIRNREAYGYRGYGMGDFNIVAPGNGNNLALSPDHDEADEPVNNQATVVAGSAKIDYIFQDSAVTYRRDAAVIAPTVGNHEHKILAGYMDFA